MNLGGRKELNVRTVGQIRQSQLVTTYGSGAIADMPNYSVILGATDYWNDDSSELREPNLEKLLRVDLFKQPLARNDSEFPQKDIPALRFPVMHFCPECGDLKPFWGFTNKEDGLKCTNCNKNIVPTRFVAACVNGHLEDFPYDWWVHGGKYSECSRGKNDNLKIEFLTDTGGLESILIICKKCGKSRTMAGSMTKEALRGYKCHGKRPWIGLKKEDNDPSDCNASMMGVQRGASNLYYSVTATALTIPPWSGRIQAAIEQQGPALKSNWEIKDMLGKNYDILLENMFKKLLDAGVCNLEKIKAEIERNFRDGKADNFSEEMLMYEEYMVLKKGNDDDPFFKAEKTAVPECLSEYLSEVVLVKRLRVVMALKGFRRIYPDAPEPGDKRYEGYHHETDYIPLGSQKENWLPAIEMMGEGIFIGISEEKLVNWEKQNSRRYTDMGKRLENSHIGKGKFSPSYVLLHTISHLLIRQLTMECGYSGAAIKERIYSTYRNSDQKMAGILIYTSSSDSDGSLGGLVRNGIKNQFEKVFRSMLQEATWCSSDPICIESHGQGFNSLNYAACHACTLLPETCCESSNCLLDRASVIGALDDPGVGFFEKLINNTDADSNEINGEGRKLNQT